MILNLRDISHITRGTIEIFFLRVGCLRKSGLRNYAGFDICFAGSIHRTISTLRNDLPLASFRFATALILGISDRKALFRMFAFWPPAILSVVRHAPTFYCYARSMMRARTREDKKLAAWTVNPLFCLATNRYIFLG